MNYEFKSEVAKEILRLRLSQMLINEKIKEGAFKIPIHLALGHEAIAVAVDNIMEGSDQLVLSHRNIHYNLARAKALKPELDEYLLKKEGLAQGRLGSMNLANEDKNIVYTSSILANNLAVAAGLALGKKIKKDKSIVIVETGDGAIEEGSFYETLEFLRSNNLPALIIVENNGWSLATEIKERRCDIDLAKFSEAFGIRYANLKSNDVYEYIEKLKELRKLSLDETSPIVVEVELTTLGFWRMQSETDPVGRFISTAGVSAVEGTRGRFINYHAGSAPEVEIGNGFRFDDPAKDPVYVLEKYFSQDELDNAARIIMEKLNQEIV